MGAASAESVGGESGRDGGETESVDNNANEGVGSSEDNQGEPGVSSGEQGDRGPDSKEPGLFDNPPERKDSGRSGNTGRKRGDDNGQVGKTGGSDNSGNDSSRGSSNRPKRIVKQTRQELKAERDDILKALSAAFEEGHKKGQGELSLDLTFGVKNYNWGVILPISLNLAHNLVKTSVRIIEDFLEKNKDGVYDKSTNTIRIFANTNIYSFDAIEENLFHENLHAYMENFGNIYDFEFFDNLWSFLKYTVDDEDFIAEQKQGLVDLGYNDNKIQEELSVYAISCTMRESNTFVFEKAISAVKDILYDYFISIGYDRETEDKRRRSKAVNNERNEETLLRESEEGGEQGFEGRDREYLEAVDSGNLERAQEMVNEDAEMYLDEFNALQDDANEVGFKYHRGPAPTKTHSMKHYLKEGHK